MRLDRLGVLHSKIARLCKGATRLGAYLYIGCPVLMASSWRDAGNARVARFSCVVENSSLLGALPYRRCSDGVRGAFRFGNIGRTVEGAWTEFINEGTEKRTSAAANKVEGGKRGRLLRASGVNQEISGVDSLTPQAGIKVRSQH